MTPIVASSSSISQHFLGGLRGKPSHGRKLTTKENTQALLVIGGSLVDITMLFKKIVFYHSNKLYNFFDHQMNQCICGILIYFFIKISIHGVGFRENPNSKTF
jgi:hypothetical protein